MFFSGLRILAGIMILGVIFISGAAFWIIFGIRKFRWALVTSIVLSVFFVIIGGMLSFRVVSAKTNDGGRLAGRLAGIERNIDRMEPGLLKGKVAGFRRLRQTEGPEIEFNGIEKEELEEIRENRDKIESITVNVDVEVEYKKE
ncbi:MAG: hypothetical protein U9O59_01070 [Actinomycetota bacterium]|nr:hypothetical protein [Actinomycetota bacterium]